MLLRVRPWALLVVAGALAQALPAHDPEVASLAAFGPGEGLSAQQLRDAYGMGPVHAQGLDGDGVALALVTWGPPSQEDLDAYSDASGLPRVALEMRAPHAATCAGEGHPEWDLDAQLAHAMAPRARILVYCADAPRLADLLVALALAIREGEADVVSISWGTCEPAVAPEVADAYAAMAAEAARRGIAVFVASGDGGSRECTRRAAGDLALATSFPAVLPDVVAVGGTRLELEPARVETVWNTCAPCPESAWAASGGGRSLRFAAPWWQPPGPRLVADVSAVADRETGPVIVTGGVWTRVGGTSVAAPLWAGAWAALVEETGRLGNPAPLLWTLAPDAQQDVVDGHNGDFEASAGHDLPTGWGTLDGEALLDALGPAADVTGSPLDLVRYVPS